MPYAYASVSHNTYVYVVKFSAVRLVEYWFFGGSLLNEAFQFHYIFGSFMSMFLYVVKNVDFILLLGPPVTDTHGTSEADSKMYSSTIG